MLDTEIFLLMKNVSLICVMERGSGPAFLPAHPVAAGWEKGPYRDKGFLPHVGCGISI